MTDDLSGDNSAWNKTEDNLQYLTLWKQLDLDLICDNPIFPQDTLASDAVLSNQIWL